MPCATAKNDESSRYASSIRARSTRLAGSVRERAIAPNAAKSFSPIANSIACRHAVMSSTLPANQSRKPRTHVGKCESSPYDGYDGFHGIDVLASIEHVVSQILHLQNCSIRSAGKRSVEMRLDNLADHNVVIALLDDRGHTTFDRARRIDENWSAGF